MKGFFPFFLGIKDECKNTSHCLAFSLSAVKLPAGSNFCSSCMGIVSIASPLFRELHNRHRLVNYPAGVD